MKAIAKGELGKAAVFKNRAKRSAEIDRGEQDFARSLSTKKALGLSFLVGGSRLKAYAQNRAMSGQSGNKPTAKKLISAARAIRFETSGSRARKAAYIRQDEGRNTLGQKAFRAGNRIEDRIAAVTDRKLAELQRRRRR